MRLSEIDLFEAPQMVQPTDFALSDPAHNRALAKQLLGKQAEVIEDDPQYVLFRTGDRRNGNLTLIDKAAQTIDYLAHYTEKHYNFIGTTVTQLKLWRRTGSPYVQGLTARMFFEYLLQWYPAVLSDGQQTEKGRDFWLNRMAQATTKGYRVGLVNLNTRQIAWYNPAAETFKQWMDDHRAWGAEESYRALRYLIAK